MALLAAIFLSPLPGTVAAISGPTDIGAESAARAPSPTVASDPELASELEQSLVSEGHSAEAHQVLLLPLSTVSRFLEVNADPSSTTEKFGLPTSLLSPSHPPSTGASSWAPRSVAALRARSSGA